jgi:hypothetical protein
MTKVQPDLNATFATKEDFDVLAHKCAAMELESQQQKQQLEALQLQVSQLVSQLQQHSPNTAPSQDGEQQKKKTAQQKLEPTAEPIRYDEAFESIGGQAALDAFADISRNLVDKISDKELTAQIDELLPADFKHRIAYSTANVNQDYVESLDDLYAKAQRVLPSYARTIETLAHKTKGIARIAPLKGRIRARAKATFKYLDSNGDTCWYRLTDIVRATLEYLDIETVSKLRKSLMSGRVLFILFLSKTCLISPAVHPRCSLSVCLSVCLSVPLFLSLSLYRCTKHSRKLSLSFRAGRSRAAACAS